MSAFKFTNAKCDSQCALYRIVPFTGQQFVTAEAAKKTGPNYWIIALPKRLTKRLVLNNLIMQLVHKGDKVDDATAV